MSHRMFGPLCSSTTPPFDVGTLGRCQSATPGLLCVASTDDWLCRAPSHTREWHLMSVAGGFPPDELTTSPDGLKLLKGVEKLRLKPYDDQTTLDTDQWVKGATIGYGHLIKKDDWDKFKDGITEEAADALFLADLAPYETVVSDAIKVGLQQYQFDALVIFAFNTGPKALPGSSVAKMINDPTAKTAYPTLEKAWKSWNKSQGKVMKGLDNRRHCEWRIYTDAVYERW